MYIDKFKIKLESGMTFVELLLVIAVFSILITGLIMIINPTAQIAKSNDAKRKSDLAQMQRALEVYYQDKGSYPVSIVNWGASWNPYMVKLPKDPVATNTYVYVSPNSGACVNNQCYYIYANLQQARDPQACNGGVACSSLATNGIANNACGRVCNYGVSSPNVSP